MVYPVTGPEVQYQSSPGLNGTGSYHLGRARYRQARPYNLILPYATYFGRTKSYQSSGTWPWPLFNYGDATVNGNIHSGIGPVGARSYLVSFTFGDSLVNDTVELARQRFVSKLQDNRSDWATTLIQRQQTLDSIANRAMQLLGAARALRKGGPRALAKALGLSVHGKSSKPRRTLRSFSSAWLEYSYGWAPLASDIENSVSLLADPLPRSDVRGRATLRLNTYQRRVYGSQDGDVQTRSSNREVRATVAAHVAISNPNTFLASQLGLTNPAAIAWELVPWSFVVDWFVNVGDFLESFSALHGVEVVSPYTSVKSSEYVHFSELHPDIRHILPDSQWGMCTVGSEVVATARQVGIPGAKLGIRRGGFLNPIRAANAISLLIQQGLKPGAR